MWHKARLDKECSKLLQQMKQDKLQWLQDPSQLNRDDLLDPLSAVILTTTGRFTWVVYC
jgi:hypothetical protein